MLSRLGVKNFIRFIRKKGTWSTECCKKSTVARTSLSQFGGAFCAAVKNVVAYMEAFAKRTF